MRHTFRSSRRAAALLVALLGASFDAAAVDPGQPAPAFSLAKVGADRPIALADFRGKIVLVDFWASWCVPCRESMPLYDKLRGEFKNGEFDVVAINLDEERKDADGFLAKHPVSYSVALDPAGDVAKAYGLIGMPTSYLVDQQGVVRARHTGFKAKDIDDLRSEIAKLSGSAHAP